jgi:putative ABC transport system permease protein
VLDDEPREIIGIVADVRQDLYQSSPVPQMYVLRGQLPLRMDMQNALEVLVSTFVVRTGGDPDALVAPIRSALHDIDPTLTVSTAKTVDEYASGQLEELRQFASVLALFGALSLALALIGVVGVMAQMVGQRATEIAIRLAVGAQSSDVVGLILRHAAMLIAGGMAIGVIASLMLTPVLGRLLWGVTATDPVTVILVVAGLAVTGLAACSIPALRALRVRPIAALRAD